MLSCIFYRLGIPEHCLVSLQPLLLEFKFLISLNFIRSSLANRSSKLKDIFFVSTYHQSYDNRTKEGHMKLTHTRPIKVAEFFLAFAAIAAIIMTIVYEILKAESLMY
jgi:hypothetical protein